MRGGEARWALGAAGACAGFYVGLLWLGRLSTVWPLALSPDQATGLALTATLGGGVFGHQLGLSVLRWAGGGVRTIERRLASAHGVDILAGVSGAVAGLIVAWLLTPATGHLPWVARAAVTLLAAWLGAAIFLRKRDDWRRLWPQPAEAKATDAGNEAGAAADGRPKILDTSAIIDGRVAGLCETGFLEGPLVVATCVLDELRHMADSGDEQRRQRGRYGLEVLGNLQKDQRSTVRIEERDPDPAAEVDMKLVMLARESGGHVVTTDFNLNKVAELQGVAVLNVNALADALRPRHLKGEQMVVRIVGIGRQPGQGLAYLADGTMVIVEGGRQRLNESVEIEVTNFIQNPQGRMIFGKLRPEHGPS